MEISKFLKNNKETDNTYPEEHISKGYDDLNIFPLHQNNNQTKNNIQPEYDEKTLSLTNFFKNIFSKVIIQNPTIITNEIFENNSIIHYIQKNNLKEININELIDEYKNQIFSILNQNYPLSEIIELQPGEKVIKTHFSGIKKLNDYLNPDFTDKKCNTFKNILKENIKSHSCIHKKPLVDTYKNLAFVTNCKNSEDISFLFGNMGTKKEVFDIIGENFNENHFKILHKDLNEVKEFVYNNLTFGIGKSTVSHSNNYIDKLETVRQAEISSKINKIDNILDIKEYNEQEFDKNLETTLILKNNIIEKYKNKTIIINNKTYPIIDKLSKSISKTLVKCVKKYPELIKIDSLKNEITKYITQLNNCMDFIPAIIGKINNENKTFLQSKEINFQKKSGIINTNFLLTDFKGGLNKEAFFNEIKGKQGTHFFLDFADIGIENILEYDRILTKYFELKRLGKEDKTLLLEAGHLITDKIVEIRQCILKLFPNAVITYGGDEFYIFIENTETPEIMKKLSNSILKRNMKARFIFNTTGIEDKQNIYKNLEGISKINKTFEDMYNIELYSQKDSFKVSDSNMHFDDDGEEKEFKNKSHFGELKISGVKLCPMLEELLSQNTKDTYDFINNINLFIKDNINYIMTHQNDINNKGLVKDIYAIPTGYSHIDLKVTNYGNGTISLYFYFNDNI